jgi:hypothetical protein
MPAGSARRRAEPQRHVIMRIDTRMELTTAALIHDLTRGTADTTAKI